MDTPDKNNKRRPHRLQLYDSSLEKTSVFSSPKLLSRCCSPRSPLSPRSSLFSPRVITNSNQVVIGLLKSALEQYPDYLQTQFPEDNLPTRIRHDKLRNILWAQFLLCMLDPAQPKDGFIPLMEKLRNEPESVKENEGGGSEAVRLEEIEKMFQKIYRNLDTLGEKDLKGYLSIKLISVLSPEASSEKTFLKIMEMLKKIFAQEASAAQQYSKVRP